MHPLPNRQAPCRLEQAPARRWRRPLPPPGRQAGFGSPHVARNRPDRLGTTSTAWKHRQRGALLLLLLLLLLLGSQQERNLGGSHRGGRKVTNFAAATELWGSLPVQVTTASESEHSPEAVSSTVAEARTASERAGSCQQASQKDETSQKKSLSQKETSM